MIKRNNSLKWIAVYTKPRHEKAVSNELYKKGYEVFLPLLKERRKWSDRKKWIEFPLFRSYLFVRTDLKNVLFIIQTSGVVKVIKFGAKIGIIHDNIIKSISHKKLPLHGIMWHPERNIKFNEIDIKFFKEIFFNE